MSTLYIGDRLLYGSVRGIHERLFLAGERPIDQLPTDKGIWLRGSGVRRVNLVSPDQKNEEWRSMNFARPFVGLAVSSVLAFTAMADNPKSAQTAPSVKSQSPVEDIYVLRSLREARSTTPSRFCDTSKIGFKAQIEDRYTFKAVATQPKDGRVVDATRQDAGTLQACLDNIPGVADANFYAEGQIAGVNATGKGQCTITAVDFPEAGITSFRCFLVLSNLSPPYFAGVLTTNTIRSREPLGERSDPPGYIQPSIATIRLWKKR